MREQIVATVISPHRFRTKKQFFSYCGLGIVTHSSSDWGRNSQGAWERRQIAQPRGLNRNRNPILKRAFRGAADAVINTLPKHSLHVAYQRAIAAGTKPNLARLTLARRLAASVLVSLAAARRSPRQAVHPRSYQLKPWPLKVQLRGWCPHYSSGHPMGSRESLTGKPRVQVPQQQNQIFGSRRGGVRPAAGIPKTVVLASTRSAPSSNCRSFCCHLAAKLDQS